MTQLLKTSLSAAYNISDFTFTLYDNKYITGSYVDL
jgi:hypothetical protein